MGHLVWNGGVNHQGSRRQKAPARHSRVIDGPMFSLAKICSTAFTSAAHPHSYAPAHSLFFIVPIKTSIVSDPLCDLITYLEVLQGAGRVVSAVLAVKVSEERQSPPSEKVPMESLLLEDTGLQALGEAPRCC